MSNLLNDNEGRNIVLTAQRFLLQRRLSRYFKRNIVIDYDRWSHGTAEFDLSTTLGELNAANDDELRDLYRLLASVGGLETTLATMEFYVDPTSGSDTTGTGSATRPYASLWFLGRLPRTIAHIVRVFLLGDVSLGAGEDDRTVFDHTFTDDGCLSIVGVHAPTVLAGPYTVAAAGALTQLGGSYIQATGPFGGDYAGKFVQMLDGTNAGNAAPVQSHPNTDDLLTRRLPFSGVAPGDTFQFIEPAITVTTNSLAFQCRGARSSKVGTQYDGRVSIVNLNIEFDTGEPFRDGNTIFSVENDCRMNISFCKIMNHSNDIAIRSDINIGNAFDNDIVADSLSTVVNLNNGTFGITPNICGFVVEEAHSATSTTLIDRSAHVRGLQSLKGVTLTDNSQLEYGWCETVYCQNWNGKILNMMIQGHSGGGSNAGIEMENSIGWIDQTTILISTNCISIDNSNVNIGDVGADVVGPYSTITDYGIYFIGIGVVQEFDTPTNLTGALNDIVFPGLAGPVAHPAIWSNVTDGQNSAVKRLGL